MCGKECTCSLGRVCGSTLCRFQPLFTRKAWVTTICPTPVGNCRYFAYGLLMCVGFLTFLEQLRRAIRSTIERLTCMISQAGIPLVRVNSLTRECSGMPIPC